MNLVSQVKKRPYIILLSMIIILALAILFSSMFVPLSEEGKSLVQGVIGMYSLVAISIVAIEYDKKSKWLRVIGYLGMIVSSFLVIILSLFYLVLLLHII